MADADQEAWWRTTKALAVAALGGAALIGFLAFAFARLIGGIVIFALSLDYLLPAAIVPLILVAVVFWYARRQAEVDRQHQMTED